MTKLTSPAAGGNPWLHRAKFSGTHLLFSLAVAAVVAAVIFFVWYPPPFRTLSGGAKLFLLVASVDVCLGPLATFVISSPGKSRREWLMDVSLVVLIQLGALGYGMWTVYVARPAFMAFEFDRFRVVRAGEVPPDMLKLAPEGYRALPMDGPRLLAVRPFVSQTESFDATMAALGGAQLSARPDLWQPYDSAKDRVRESAKPLADLMKKLDQAESDLMQTALGEATKPVSQLLFLPLVDGGQSWTVILDASTLEPLAYAPVDAFR